MIIFLSCIAALLLGVAIGAVGIAMLTVRVFAERQQEILDIVRDIQETLEWQELK